MMKQSLILSCLLKPAILEEIDSSTESSMKGISLMMVDPVVGLYRPYIWSNALHGAIQAGPSGIGDVVSAVHELEKKGFLAFYEEKSKSLSQYRRTEKQP